MTASSHRWLHERSRDPYVKSAREQGWRSRAAFKLRQMDEKKRLFRMGMRVIDLGAAPGGWSQYAASRVGDSGTVVAVDLVRMDPLPGVHFVHGDGAQAQVRSTVLVLLGGKKAEVVMSDMAPCWSGNAVVDMPKAVALACASLDFAKACLVRGGDLLLKLFQGEGCDDCLAKLDAAFSEMRIVKPKASRARSREVYVLAEKFNL